MNKFFCYKDKYDNIRIRIDRIILCIILIAFILITIKSSFVIIPTGYTGVKTVFGQVSDEIISNGFNWKIPYIQHISKVNNKQQERTFFENELIWGETNEQTVVYMTNVVITYKIEPEYSAWVYANVADYTKNVLPDTLVASAMKTAMACLSSRDVTNRGKIEPIALSCLQLAINNRYNGEQVINIINVSINNMDFEDEYNNVIAQRQQAQIEYERQQIINKTTIEQAEAQASQKKAMAEGEAQAQLIAANAEAEAITIKAEAEAKANKTITASLTDEIIKKMYYDTWDGVLPQTILGDDTTVMMPIGDNIND